MDPITLERFAMKRATFGEVFDLHQGICWHSLEGVVQSACAPCIYVERTGGLALDLEVPDDFTYDIEKGTFEPNPFENLILDE